jgi:GTPase
MDVGNQININTLGNLQNQFNSLSLECMNIINISKNSVHTIADKLLLQVEIKLEEGSGECIYEIISDKSSEEELKENLEAFNKLAIRLDAFISIIRTHYTDNALIAEIIIRKNSICPELKIGLFGDEGSGKSTLAGVLVTGILDFDGTARQAVLRYPHEMQTGKTTSISHQVNIKINQVIGFNRDGKILRKEDIINSVKIVNIYDLGGSEKSMKFTVY